MARRQKTLNREPTRSPNPSRSPLQFPSLLRRAASRKELNRAIDGDIRALEGEGNDRKFEISFSSEEPCNRFFGKEILDHSPGAVDLSRLNTIGVVLFNHDRDQVLGKIERAWVEGDKGKAVIVFDKDELAETIYQKVLTGTLKGVSVGYRVRLWELVKTGAMSSNGKFAGPCDVATDWEPYEISIVSVPADATVGVGRDMEAQARETAAMAARQVRVNINSIL